MKIVKNKPYEKLLITHKLDMKKQNKTKSQIRNGK